MPNPYHVALREARWDTRFLDVLFGRYIGTAAHPRGRILSVYRAARAAVDRALHANDWMATADALETLRYALLGLGSEAMGQASARGQASMEAQIEAYREDAPTIEPARQRPDLQPPLANTPRSKQRIRPDGVHGFGYDGGDNIVNGRRGGKSHSVSPREGDR